VSLEPLSARLLEIGSDSDPLVGGGGGGIVSSSEARWGKHVWREA